MGIGAIDISGGTPGAAGAVSLWGPSSGGVVVRHHVADTFKPFSLTTVTTEQLIWDPAAGKKFRLLGFTLKATVETLIAFLDGTGGTVVFRVGAADSQPITLDLGPIGILSGAANANLYITSSASADVAGTAWGTEE
jgi:hypothetical protein